MYSLLKDSYLLTNPMDTQPKTEPKRSQLLTEAISKAQYKKREQKKNKTVLEKAIETNQKNVANAWFNYFNK